VTQNEQIDHCRRLNPSFSHGNFSEIASFRILFSRPTRVTASCVRHSSLTQTPSPVETPSISLVKEVVEGRKYFSFTQPSEAHDSLSVALLCDQLQLNPNKIQGVMGCSDRLFLFDATRTT
jgi:hypothetical protein